MLAKPGEGGHPYERSDILIVSLRDVNHEWFHSPLRGSLKNNVKQRFYFF